GRDVEAGAGGAGQAAGRRRQRVAGADLVDRQAAEGHHAARRRGGVATRQRPGDRGAAVVGEGETDTVGGVGGEVAVEVEHLDGDGRRDGPTRRGRRRLLSEDERR